LYDDLVNNPLSLIRDVYSFLGVDPTFAPPSATRRVNEAGVVLPRSRAINDVSGRLARVPLLRRLARPIDQFNMTQVPPEELNSKYQLDPEMRARMQALYQNHNQRLGAFLGRNLSHWNRGSTPNR
jgi:hypothetical protein